MANIAEGYGRYHYLDKLRFFCIARGSLDETINHILTASDLEYISETQLEKLHELAQEAHRTLNDYIGYVRKRQQGVKEFGDTALQEARVVYVVADDELVDQ